MAKTPPKKPKDPARPTRAKAARPVEAATPDSLADLLNPGIKRGTAGLGSGTGRDSNLQPPPDTSWERRKDFSAAHTARKSAREGFSEAPQSDYTGSPITGLDPALAKELGLGDDLDLASPSPAGGGSARGGGVGCAAPKKIHPLPASFARRPPPSRGR